ncbi:MAG: hypothetical protein KDD42_04855 [Bdellovibrionales bacterium]|nr:hypothetical protein [Bdellovibrionales bacterium]
MTRSKKRLKNRRCSNGFAILEAAAILVVVLPIVFVVVGLVDYFYQIVTISRYLNHYVSELDLSTLRIHTNNQDYFLRTRGQDIISEVRAVARNLKSDLEEHSGARNVEVLFGAMVFRVNDQTGALEEPGEYRLNGVKQPYPVVRPWPDSSDYRGQANSPLGRIFSELFLNPSISGCERDLGGNVIACNNLPSPLAISSGLRGVRQQVHYGASNPFSATFANDPSQYIYTTGFNQSNFFRVTAIAGLYVHVDLGNSLLAVFAGALPSYLGQSDFFEVEFQKLLTTRGDF